MPTNTTQPPPELYVFLSFAGEDRAKAEQVLAFLTEAGIRVFYDKQMRSGVNWDMTIEQALKTCQRMVLLLSSSSMPEKPEVYSEWFDFMSLGKPIHPLKLEECQLHRRLKPINYRDASVDFESALELLLADLKDESPPLLSDPLTQYRLDRIAEWSQPRYELDHRFVNLTLTLDRPDDPQQRWHPVNDPPMRDLREVLVKAKDHPALVLVGAPGSGKSTLLRRLQLDHSQDRLEDSGEEVSFFVALNEHKGEQKPQEWLAKVWQDRYPAMPSLEKLLKAGRMLLLLDALNEMKPRVGTAKEQIDDWKEFVQQAARSGNRLLFSCRSRDIGAAQLGSKELPVPLVDVQPMTREQMQEFLKAYAPEHHQHIWRELDGSRQFDLFQTPYFLKLLCEQVGPDGDLPKGRAELFTRMIRNTLDRERDGALFQPGALLSERDWQKMGGREWRNAYDLPEYGKLLGKLRDLAFDMQKRGSEVSIDYDEACQLLDDERAEDILKAGTALNVLDVASDTAKFFHQLLQEYFAARRLAKEPNPALVRVEWAADKVKESLQETLAKLSDGEPLPPPAQTGWEETTLTAAALYQRHSSHPKERGSMSAHNPSFNEEHIPLAYLITFRCYGTWLHGDERGAVDRHHNRYGTPHIVPNKPWRDYNEQLLNHPPVELDAARRASVAIAITDTCAKRNWGLQAMNVRTNHVHIVVTAGCKPDVLLSAFKANATRQMREDKCWQFDHSPWVKHGSRRYLWTERHVERAVEYVINGQGDALPKFDDDE